MRSRSHKSKRGAILAFVTIALAVVASLVVAALSFNGAQFSEIETTRKTSELAVHRQSLKAWLRAAVLSQSRGEAGPSQPAIQLLNWEDGSFNPSDFNLPNPSFLYSKPFLSTSTDRGAPGTLVGDAYRVGFERAHGAFKLRWQTIERTERVEAVAYFLPGSSIAVYTGNEPLGTAGLALQVHGAVVASHGISANLNLSVEGEKGRLMIPAGFPSPGSSPVTWRLDPLGPMQSVSHGRDLGAQISYLYAPNSTDLLGGTAGTSTTIDNPEAVVPFMTTVEIAPDTRVPAIDLNTFPGPKSIHINLTGAAANNGIVVIGSAGAGNPVSILVRGGPVTLAGSNNRPVVVVTDNAVCLRSRATTDSIPHSGPASAVTWVGRIVWAATNPSFHTDEDWSGVTWTLRGSLAWEGGKLSAAAGARPGTLTRISVRTDLVVEDALTDGSIPYDGILLTQNR